MTNPNFCAMQKAIISKPKSNKKGRFRCCCCRNDGFKDSYFLEVMVEKENNVFPMIPTGASVSVISD
jgi:acetolactate synthase-1/2/3 large subunit